MNDAVSPIPTAMVSITVGNMFDDTMHIDEPEATATKVTI
jgi:hypothetical protein